MKVEIRPPRIFRRAICAGVFVFASTFLFAHSNANSVDPVAAAQWKAGAPQVQLQGQIEIVHQDFPDGHGKFLYTLKQADGTRVPMHFVKHPPTHVLTGDHVRVSGERSTTGFVLYSGANVKNTGGGGTTGGGTTSSSIPVPYTFGAQSLLVILVNFQDNPVQPYTVADAQSAFFSKANSFFEENSYGQTSLVGDVIGWYTIPDSVTACNMSQIAADAQKAATAAGVNLSNYTRYVYAFPYDSACGWAGSSYVGGNPSQSWINGNSLDVHVVNHELGHAFGLWHSHLMDCGTSTTLCSAPTVVEYGDAMDVMGSVQTASADYNAFQKERLGWLNYGTSPPIQTVTSSGTYTISPYEVGGSGPNALKILQSTDPTTGMKTWYYLEARQATGFDAFLSNSIYYTQNESSGVLFHLGTDGDGNSSELLDMTPSTPTSGGWFDMSLVAGQSFSDSSAGVTFTPNSVDNTGATVQITMNGGGATCTAASPTVSVSPAQSQSVSSGTPVSFAVTVMDNDSSSCPAATFNLAGMLPGGWTGTLSATALPLSPGKSGSATLTVTSPAGTADATYNIVVSATNSLSLSYSSSANVAYVINTAPLTVTLTTNQSSYLPGQTVGIVATIMYGTSPNVGASVSVNVTNPKGRTNTLTGTTGSNGVATLSYKLGRNAPAGTYQAHYGTALTGAASVMGASTSFTVQ
jgi:Gametolysin peptidase M11/NPCBM-associated, NEW3 domain of alpha-galactosidase